jgi:hypothetical protein
MRWYEGSGADRLDHDRRLVNSRPELSLEFLVDANEGVALVGTVTVQLRSGIRYPIKTRIEFPSDYPQSEPRVFETGDRFKHKIDRHFYPDGRACLWLEDFETDWRADDQDALGTFLDQVLVFYLRQLAFNANPKAGYPGPWRGHGDVGLIEPLEDALRVPAQALPRMWRALAGGVYRNAPCPCGRRVRYRKCHRARIQAYRATLSQRALDGVIVGLQRSRNLRVPRELRGRRPPQR